MFLDGCGKITGCILVFLGVLFIAGGIIGGLLLPGLKDKAFFDRNIYHRDSKFNDINYEKCDNETTNVFFYNLTNSAEFLLGARPNVQQIGPYNFTREFCDYNETQDGNYIYFREYYKAPVFHPIEGSPYTENDIIVSVNPGYLGIMNGVQAKTGSTSNLEFAFETNLAGPALGQVITGMQSNLFLSQIKASALPTVLFTIRNTVADGQIVLSVRALAVIGYFFQTMQQLAQANNITSAEASVLIFNDASVSYGYTNLEVAGAFPGAQPINFPPTTVQNLLYGVSAAGLPGWLSDTTQGTGFLGFLQLVQNASLAPELAAAYGYNVTETPAIASYAGYLFNTASNTFLGGNGVAQNIAYDEFYGQWANATLFPNGFDLNKDGHTPDGFELGTNANLTSIVATGLPLAAARNLWNQSDSNSLLSDVGIIQWATALQLHLNGSDTLLLSLCAATGVPPTDIPVVAAWLGMWLQTLVVPFILQDTGVPSLDKLAFKQWGDASVLDGASIKDYQATIPAVPEWALFVLNFTGSSYNLNATRAEQLLVGPYGFVLGSNVATFLGLYAAGATTQINALWGLNTFEAGLMAAYWNYIVHGFIDPFLLYQMFPLGAGPVTGRTPAEWLWLANDPLVAYIGEDSSVGLLFDDTEATSRADAESRPLIKQEVFTGGSKADLLEYFRVKEYKGNDTVYQWETPLPVSGYPGDFWVPGSIKDDSVLTVWFDQLARPTDWHKTKEIEVKGVHLWQFEPFEYVFDNETENPNNSIFWQEVHGMVNITAVNAIRTFISHGSWFDVHPSLQDTVDGLVRTDYDQTWMFGVEPESGITMVKFATKCASVGFPTLDRFYNISEGTVPVFFIDDYQVISDSDVNSFKSQLAALAAGIIAFFVIGIILGVILLSFGAAILYRASKRSNQERSGNPLELHDIS